MHEEVVGCVGVDVASDDSSDTSDSSSSSVADFPVDASSSSNSGGGEVAPPVAEPPTPLNIMETLDSVNNIDMLFARMPDFEMNSRWEITHKPDNQVIWKIRCIQGESLRIDCRCGHVVPCKTGSPWVARISPSCSLSLWITSGSKWFWSMHFLLFPTRTLSKANHPKSVDDSSLAVQHACSYTVQLGGSLGISMDILSINRFFRIGPRRLALMCWMTGLPD